MIKNGLGGANRDVSLDSLLCRFGDVGVMVSDIPCPSLFGRKASSISLAEYTHVVLGGKRESNLCAFDTVLLGDSSKVRSGYDRAL